MVNFSPDRDIPDLSGKVFLVTGGNVGLGRESLHQIAKHNPSKIYLAARSPEKAEAAIKEINSTLKDNGGGIVKFLPCDLTSFDSIKAAAKQFTSENDRLDVLMNNAGIMATPPGTTKEGYEIQFGTNHVGHALLTKLLLPTLQNTAKTTGDARIINLSSAAHHFPPVVGIEFDKERDAELGGNGTWRRYGQSKLANILHARALAKRYPELTCVSLHPGAVNTNLLSGPIASYGGWVVEKPLRFIGWLLTTPVSKGAWNQTWAATAPLAKDGQSGVENGGFYYPVGIKNKDSVFAKDEQLADKLWDWTENELKGHDIK